MFSNKIIRCHVLDRQDQVDEGKEHIEYLKKQTVKLQERVKAAQRALDRNLAAIERKQKFVNDVEATLHIHWLNDPPY